VIRRLRQPPIQPFNRDDLFVVDEIVSNLKGRVHSDKVDKAVRMRLNGRTWDEVVARHLERIAISPDVSEHLLANHCLPDLHDRFIDAVAHYRFNGNACK